MPPIDILSRLLYRDALMLVIDKPAGLPVHKGFGGGDTLDQYFEELRFGLPNPPALGHRLDRDTSGCLALGRNRHALQTLGKLFTQNQVEKTYWAVAVGEPPQTEGIIDLPLTKQTNSKHSWWMKIAESNGMPAVTGYRIMGSHNGLSWLELTPKTGRTHQLRVHCSTMGFPILGDKVYGKAIEGTPLQLHARRLGVPLYPKKEPIAVTAPVPLHMAKHLSDCGYAGD